jgi:hypothetical protein
MTPCSLTSVWGKPTLSIFLFQLIKGKVDPALNYALWHENIWGNGGIAPLFLTSALDEGEWSASLLGRFTPRYPLDKRLGGEEKILSLPEFEPRSFSPSLYLLSYPDSLFQLICVIFDSVMYTSNEKVIESSFASH